MFNVPKFVLSDWGEPGYVRAEHTLVAGNLQQVVVCNVRLGPVRDISFPLAW
jgi:hypothetical protein